MIKLCTNSETSETNTNFQIVIFDPYVLWGPDPDRGSPFKNRCSKSIINVLVKISLAIQIIIESKGITCMTLMLTSKYLQVVVLTELHK